MGELWDTPKEGIRKTVFNSAPGRISDWAICAKKWKAEGEEDIVFQFPFHTEEGAWKGESENVTQGLSIVLNCADHTSEKRNKKEEATRICILTPPVAYL